MRVRSNIAPVENVPSDWIQIRRAIVRAGGRALRPGEKANTIEIKSVTPHDQLAAWDPMRLNAWVPLMLPGGALEFTTVATRNEVLRRLQAP